MKEIFVLCFHWVCNPIHSSGKWTAIAVFNHQPTFEDIMKLNNFKSQTDCDKAIAEKIAEKQYCAMYFGPRGKEFERNPKTRDFAHNVAEYMVIHPQENGDLMLFDYFLTGYCDFQKQVETAGKGVWYEDYEQEEKGEDDAKDNGGEEQA